MIIESLKVELFRHLKPFTYTFSPNFNLISGANASGKTSLLEAIYFLSTLRSFRTHNPRELIEKESDYFRLFAKVKDDASQRTSQLGIERGKKDFQIRKDFHTVHKRSELARLLPVLFMGPETGQTLIESPRYRRQFLDWGLFQNYPHFHPLWLRYERALKQRNAALKQKLSPRVLRGIEEEMAVAGAILSVEREVFLNSWMASALPLLRLLLPELKGWEVNYQFGFSLRSEENPTASLEQEERISQTKLKLKQALENTQARDLAVGYTRVGPHRGDFSIKVEEREAAKFLSRGQTKLLAMGLMLAQIQVFREITGQSTILLLDDLTAELDLNKRALLMTHLLAQNTQIFVTVLERSEFPELANLPLESGLESYEMSDGMP